MRSLQMIRILTGASVLLLCGMNLHADIVHLKDGSQVEGSVKHSDDGWTVTSHGTSLHLAVDQVESIELNSVASPGPLAAAERLASLRRSVNSLNDLTEIIARFQRFVDQSTEPAVTTEAKKDLALWQDRKKQKMEKVGADWVTPAEHSRRIDQAAGTVDTARQLMKQGRAKEAEPLLAEVIAIDPQNASALYLTGLLRFEQDQIPAAKKAFEAVSAIIPNHGPSLNNLGVIGWRQRQYISGLQCFDGAMLALPVNKLILDNVAVALQTLPAELQQSPVTTRARQHFAEQDQQLAESMAREGMHRFGSIWISDKDMERIHQQEKQTHDKLDALAGDFDQSRLKIESLNQNLSDDQSQISHMESSNYIYDTRTGAVVTLPYPSSYYDLQRDLAKVQRDHDAEVARLDTLKKQAQDLKNSQPAQWNQGVQRLIGADGTPIKLGINPAPMAPATQPAR